MGDPFALNDVVGMGSRPAVIDGAGLSEKAAVANVRDAIEKTTDMGTAAMGHAGNIDTPPGGERGPIFFTDPGPQEFATKGLSDSGDKFRKKDVVRSQNGFVLRAGFAAGGPVMPRGTGETFVV